MVGLAIRFDLGRYHATPWGSHVNDAAVEWPPSPWRILRALYAVSRTNVSVAPYRAAIDEALTRLIEAGPPSYQLPASSAHHTRHYMPHREHPSQSTDKVLDGFLALDPEGELQVWWDVLLRVEELAALRSAAEALGYLGRSESVCSVRVLEDRGQCVRDARPLAEASTAEDELVSLLCPSDDDPLSALTISVTELRRRRLLAPPGAKWVDFAIRLPTAAPAPTAPAERPTLARFRVRGGSRPSMRDAVAVGHLVRAALQARYGRGNGDAASAVFSGRAGEARRTDQHLHAHYLATPDADGRRVEHVVVWAPEGFGAGEVAALAALTELRLRDAEPLRLALTAIGRTDAMRLPALLGPARVWRSLTPFGLTRHPKTRGGREIDGPSDQIRRELALRGFPEPDSIEQLHGAWLEYRRTRPGRSRLEAPRAVGVRITFAEEVSGPLALGALSHFGLGLYVPER